MKSTPDVEVNSLNILDDLNVGSPISGTPGDNSFLSNTAGNSDNNNNNKNNNKTNFNGTDNGGLVDTELKKEAHSNTGVSEAYQNNNDNNEGYEINENNNDNNNKGTQGSTDKLNNPPKLVQQPSDIMDLPSAVNQKDDHDISKVSAYARLEFENFIFYVQTLQVILGRKSEHDQSHSVDVHLGASKAISRKHAKIFYNFGTERFELSIQGKNGAFVDDTFVERGSTVPLSNKAKIQIGQIVFRFVLPGAGRNEKNENISKPINPSDAISLRSTLYVHPENNEDKSPGSSSAKDFTPIMKIEKSDLQSKSNLSNDSVPNSSIDSRLSTPNQVTSDKNENSNNDQPYNNNNNSNIIDNNFNTNSFDNSNINQHIDNDIENNLFAQIGSALKKDVKEPKKAKTPKPPKKVYTIDEIPEEFRTKPACSYSNLIATCLRTHGTSKGMSLAEIYKSIKDIFPYYKYCPDGWQSSVRHNLSLNKAFRKVSKEGKGWLWGLDEEFCAEKERQKKKQAAAQLAKQQAAQLKLEQQQQLQQQKLQQQKLEQQKALLQNQQQHQINIHSLPKPLQQQAAQLNFTQMKPIPLTNNQSQTFPNSKIPLPNRGPSIQEQLAANRGSSARPGQQQQQAAAKPNPGLGADTRKALAHLQQQLVILSKDLKRMVDKPTISAILTQAIAMTIAQVTQAAKTKGITTDPMTTLIETNPQQLTKILTVALNAATFKVTNGRIKQPLNPNNIPTSVAATPSPQPTTPTPQPTPIPQHQSVPAKPAPSIQQQSQPSSKSPTPVIQAPAVAPPQPLQKIGSSADISKHEQVIKSIPVIPVNQSEVKLENENNQQKTEASSQHVPEAARTEADITKEEKQEEKIHQHPDLSFLNENLNDDEFDKAIEKLSREGTPGIAQTETKGIDQAELDRLLSSDFGDSKPEARIEPPSVAQSQPEPEPALPQEQVQTDSQTSTGAIETNPHKRSFDQIEDSSAGSDTSKIPKT